MIFGEIFRKRSGELDDAETRKRVKLNNMERARCSENDVLEDPPDLEHEQSRSVLASFSCFPIKMFSSAHRYVKSHLNCNEHTRHERDRYTGRVRGRCRKHAHSCPAQEHHQSRVSSYNGSDRRHEHISATSDAMCVGEPEEVSIPTIRLTPPPNDEPDDLVQGIKTSTRTPGHQTDLLTPPSAVHSASPRINEDTVFHSLPDFIMRRGAQRGYTCAYLDAKVWSGMFCVGPDLAATATADNDDDDDSTTTAATDTAYCQSGDSLSLTKGDEEAGLRDLPNPVQMKEDRAGGRVLTHAAQARYFRRVERLTDTELRLRKTYADIAAHRLRIKEMLRRERLERRHGRRLQGST